ncbi:hypothetical protein W97_01737 [Coniosporium apollinis CBS 100218]|uniref:Uncharacterized protein n=1 Tax=Coniosporium apollinis (strain CBS 100218) TaxID=1168221 RepID=R7YL16_CONA1|nr:uncharacterized protein W97_01737 [Coniosporium apollinis CBS 100218]EON62514.1 hypothetical protein W97_01737 [Coniosporium apollinis CBS 100218]
MLPKRSVTAKSLRGHTQAAQPPPSRHPTREEADLALFHGTELLGCRYPERECNRGLYETLEVMSKAHREQLAEMRRSRGIHAGLNGHGTGRGRIGRHAHGMSAAKPVYIEDDEDEGGFELSSDEDDVNLRFARELGSIEGVEEEDDVEVLLRDKHPLDGVFQEDESGSLVDEERGTHRRNARLAKAPISSSHYWAEDDLEGLSAEDDSYTNFGEGYSEPRSGEDDSEPAFDGDDLETPSEEDNSDSRFYEDMNTDDILRKGGPSTRGRARPAEAPIHRPRYIPRDERIDKVTGEVWHADCPDNFPFGETRFMENYIGYTFSRDLAAAEAREKETGERFNVSAAPPAEDISGEDLKAKTKEQEDSDLALYDILNQPRYRLPDLPKDAEAQHRKMEKEGVFDDKHLEALEKEWPATTSEKYSKFDAVYGPKIKELNDAAILDQTVRDKRKRKIYDRSPNPVKEARWAKA